ncbi:hypothetical protein [Lujinxingia vulgaris]|uniref:hypothetical protein n=1 Tax=Lujinxingia vulgaris TaxID=2600176 RepID=UPI001E2DC67B|nr:hypothetical protein [Lujinxingia vulgaris]
MQVNALGPALVVKHLTPLLRHSERTVIANLSARVGSIGDNRLGGWYSYRASKAAQTATAPPKPPRICSRAPWPLSLGTIDAWAS